MTDLTPGAVALALRTCATMANAPEMVEGDFAVWCDDLTYEGVSKAELLRAVGEIRRKQEFFPQVATVLERVNANRQRDFLERQAQETQERIRERAASFRSLPAPEPAQGDTAPMDELEVPPPRNPPPKGKYPSFGAVRLPDGRLDPRWPEIPGRDPAWRRKLRYDHGIDSYEAATAPTIAKAKSLTKRGDGFAGALNGLETNR